ncbi:hypothetical protein C0991_002839 [Blastosporella zonata]|nr:hypothetical protein C0991_002839 [Blastosporella zonata]
MAQLLQLAHHQPLTPYHTSLIAPIHTTCEKEQDGVTLGDLGRLHAAREAALPSTHKLSWLHEQVALGECGLAWCVLHAHGRGAEQGVIPLRSIEQWFGKERLPDGWWDVGGGRPVREVGLKDARKRAAEAGLFRDGRQPYSLYTY